VFDEVEDEDEDDEVVVELTMMLLKLPVVDAVATLAGSVATLELTTLANPVFPTDNPVEEKATADAEANILFPEVDGAFPLPEEFPEEFPDEFPPYGP